MGGPVARRGSTPICPSSSESAAQDQSAASRSSRSAPLARCRPVAAAMLRALVEVTATVDVSEIPWRAGDDGAATASALNTTCRDLLSPLNAERFVL
jgi:hypothetical protein